MDQNDILINLPYSIPFLFVDDLEYVNESGAKGFYTFQEDEDFFKGHFKGNPVTPGVILTECCAQIGLVSLGIFLMESESPNNLQIGFSSSEMEFFIPVYPKEKVTVTSEKMYFRFNKLKCKVKMHNEKGELVCKGVLAGMLKKNKDE